MDIGTGLTLVPEKSECIVLTGKHAYNTLRLHIQGYQVPVKKTITYLGMHLDTRMIFVQHATSAAAGSKRAAAALRRLMPNVEGPSRSKLRLLTSVVNSRLLYGAQVWADSEQDTNKSVNALLQAQRVAALRVTRCYRTVLDMAALVLAGMTPVSLLAAPRKKIAESNKSGIPMSKSLSTREILGQWQQLWISTPKAA